VEGEAGRGGEGRGYGVSSIGEARRRRVGEEGKEGRLSLARTVATFDFKGTGPYVSLEDSLSLFRDGRRR